MLKKDVKKDKKNPTTFVVITCILEVLIQTAILVFILTRKSQETSHEL